MLSPTDDRLVADRPTTEVYVTHQHSINDPNIENKLLGKSKNPLVSTSLALLFDLNEYCCHLSWAVCF